MRCSVRITAAALCATLMMFPGLLASAELSGYQGDPAIYRVLTVTTPQSGSAADVAPDPRPLTERFTWLLPTAVTLATGLIGLFLVSLAREVRRRLPPPDPPD